MSFHVIRGLCHDIVLTFGRVIRHPSSPRAQSLTVYGTNVERESYRLISRSFIDTALLGTHNNTYCAYLFKLNQVLLALVNRQARKWLSELPTTDILTLTRKNARGESSRIIHSETVFRNTELLTHLVVLHNLVLCISDILFLHPPYNSFDLLRLSLPSFFWELPIFTPYAACGRNLTPKRGYFPLSKHVCVHNCA